MNSEIRKGEEIEVDVGEGKQHRAPSKQSGPIASHIVSTNIP